MMPAAQQIAARRHAHAAAPANDDVDAINAALLRAANKGSTAEVTK
jgi:hypothetical protein